MQENIPVLCDTAKKSYYCEQVQFNTSDCWHSTLDSHVREEWDNTIVVGTSSLNWIIVKQDFLHLRAILNVAYIAQF